MSAFLISDVKAKTPEAFDAYRAHAAASLALYGGRQVSRRGTLQITEGCWAPQAFVIVEFDTVEQARDWYESPEHAEAMALRVEAYNGDMILVDGAAGDSD